MHSGGTQEAPRRHPGAAQRRQESPRGAKTGPNVIEMNLGFVVMGARGRPRGAKILTKLGQQGSKKREAVLGVMLEASLLAK